MCGVAQQGHAAARHFACRTHRSAVAQGPQAPDTGIDRRLRGGVQQVAQGRARAAHPRHQFIGIGLMVPAVRVFRRCAFSHHDQIQPLAAPHGVLHGVHARPQPDRDALAAQGSGQICLPQHGAPGQVA